MDSVVIIEDNLYQREMLETIVAKELGLRTHLYASAEHFFNSDLNHSNCTYLIDWNLPGIQGPDIVRTIRKKDEISPIFMVSANFSDESVIEGVEAGADDYFIKPYSPILLVKKIIRARKRYSATKDQLLNIGLKLFEESGMVIRNGNPISLTRREFQVFKCLYVNRERVLKREELLSSTPDAEAIGRKIDMVVSSLRKKVAQIGLEIETVRGEGYQLT